MALTLTLQPLPLSVTMMTSGVSPQLQNIIAEICSIRERLMVSFLTNARISGKLAAIGVIAVLALAGIVIFAALGFGTVKSSLDTVEKSRAAVGNRGRRRNRHQGDRRCRAQPVVGANPRGWRQGGGGQVCAGWLRLTRNCWRCGPPRSATTAAARSMPSGSCGHSNGGLVKTTVEATQGKLERRALFFRRGPPLSAAMTALVAEVDKDGSPAGVATAALAQRAGSPWPSAGWPSGAIWRC